MFQAIVHAPVLRSGARLCLSDLEQGATKPPTPLAPGAAVSLRYGACCPDRGAGDITAREADQATLRVADAQWRMQRCPARGGIDLPGLVSEDWFVIGRAPQTS